MILNIVPFRSSVEPSVKDLRFAYAAETSASRPPAFVKKRPRDNCDGVTSPIEGCAGSMPPIVYEELLMFVCGGLTTCLSVCWGVVIRARNSRIRAGRHFRAAGELKATARDKLKWLDGLMGAKPFVAGDKLTMADILLFAFLDFMANVGQPLDPECKNLTAWYGRMKARPSAAA